MERTALTVTELNERVKGLLEHDPMLSDVCVRGELSNYKIYPSGHHYFTLKDSDSSLKCVMFRSAASKLRFRPENGMNVTVFGRVSVYTRDGAYQLYANAIIPIGAGDLQIAFEQLKAKLAAEGLFDAAHKKPLPPFPRRIAVITSPAGAAVHDMIRILSRRWPMAEVVLVPVRVQGTEAPGEIARAIAYANRERLADLIITGRGGGSVEDLWAFNDERVARAIYASELPVISAVGHEPDVTISDYAADVRASTPSNAAERAVPEQEEIREQLYSYDLRLSQSVHKRFSLLSDRLERLKQRRVLTDPMAVIDDKRMRLDRERERLISVQEKKLSDRRRETVRLASALDAMSPLRVLTRGYAMVSGKDGNVVSNVAALTAGDEICVRFTDGAALCRVKDINEEKLWPEKN